MPQMMNEEVEMKLAAVRADIQATKHNLNLKTNELSMLKTAYADACKRQGKLLAEVSRPWNGWGEDSIEKQEGVVAEDRRKEKGKG